MKKFLYIIAAAALLVSCIDENEDGIAMKLPESMAKQWVGEQLIGETFYRYEVWNFESFKNQLSIVHYYSTLEDWEMIPTYNSSKENIYSYECRYRDGVYTITLNDEAKSKFYLSDVTSKSMILTYEDGYVMNMTVLPFTLSPVPVDY